MTETLTSNYIYSYMNAAKSEKIKVCKEQLELFDYLENRVFVRDDIYFDSDMVHASIESPKPYFPFELFSWQKFLHCFLYGFRWKETDKLVFDTFLVYVGRGAGKNGLIGWNSFFVTSNGHGIQNYDVDLYATSEDQARRSFADVEDVINRHPILSKSFDNTKKVIKSKRTSSEIRYNTSNARTKDGKRPGMNVFDEIHEYEDYKSISVATSGGGKVQDYREIYITTDGNVRGGPLDDLKEEAKLILSGELGIDKVGAAYSTLFPFIFKLDDPKEVDDPEMWEKACPSVNFNPSLKNKMLAEYSKMQRNASLRIEFMTKRMNCPVEDTRFAVAEYEDLLNTKEEDIPEGFYECIGGVDFAEVRDFCSVGILLKNDGKTYWKQHTFIHKKALELQDINQTLVDIALEKGHAEMVYSKMIEPKLIVDWYLKMAKTYHVKKIALDSFRASILKPALEEAGFEVEIVRRGTITHSKLSPLIDKLFIDRQLFFGDDEMMRWYVKNVYKHIAANDNIEYKKIEPERRKTDGFFAFTHALNFYDSLDDYSEDDYEIESFSPIVI